MSSAKPFDVIARQGETTLVIQVPAVAVEAAALADADSLTVAVRSFLSDDDDPTPLSDVSDLYGIDVRELLERRDFTGDTGQRQVIDLPRPARDTGSFPWANLPRQLIVLGIGDASASAWRRAGAAWAKARRAGTHSATGALAGERPEAVSAFVQGAVLGSYRFPRAAKKPEDLKTSTLTLLGEVDADVVEQAQILAGATCLVRDLGATPSNVKNPKWFADTAMQLTRNAALQIARNDGLSVQVHELRDLADEGFGGILSVGSGSATPPALVEVTYTPTGDDVSGQRVVIVGKGITYDTGGLSLKPREAMVSMKTDMAGAAAAFGTVLAAAQLGVRHQVTAVLPLAENAFGGAAYRPGDVVTTYSGKTVEIANTDAEGRMVLADGLGYAVAELEPDLIIDIATLTGAVTLALGRGHAGCYATETVDVMALESAGERSGEIVWPMPLADEYRSTLDSKIADIRHVNGDPSPGAGSITAALFLREFVGDIPWVHLDIAGVGRAASDSDLAQAGPTGWGARYLTELLRQPELPLR